MAVKVSNLTHAIAAKNGYVWLGFSDVKRIGSRIFWVTPQYLDGSTVLEAPVIIAKSRFDLDSKKYAYIGDVRVRSFHDIYGGKVDNGS